MKSQQKANQGVAPREGHSFGVWLRKALAFIKAHVPHSRPIGTKETLIGIALLVVLTIVVNEVGRNVIVIEAFSVPKVLDEDGYGPGVIANQLADNIADLRFQAGRFARGHPQFALSSETTLPDVQVAEAKLSLNGIVDYVRRILGRDHAIVDGAISILTSATASRSAWNDPSTRLVITVRVKNAKQRLRQYKRIQVSASDLAGGIQQAAREVLVTLDPLVAAVTDRSIGNAASAAELARSCSHDRNKQYAAQCYLIQGALLFDKGTPEYYGQAISMFSAALGLDKGLPQAIVDQGVAYQRLGQFTEALKMFADAERVIKDDPDMLASVYVNRGLVFAKQHDVARAIASYEKATRVDPTHALAFNNWCDSLMEQGRLAEARPICEHAIEADPQLAMSYATFGELLAKQDKLSEAQSMFRRATDIDPRFVAAWLAWGESLSAHGKEVDVQAVYREGLLKNPNEQRLKDLAPKSPNGSSSRVHP